MDYLLIHLQPGQPDQVRWLALTPGQPPGRVAHGLLADAARAAAGRAVVLLVPGEEVLLTEVTLRLRNSAKLRKAVPYALEDALAGDLEHLHFALGPRQGERTPVAVVDRERMGVWLERLAELDIVPRHVLPDVLCLPWQEGEWGVLLDDQRALVRTGPTSGFATERDNLLPLLLAALEGEDGPAALRVWPCAEGGHGLEGLRRPLVAARCDGEPLTVLAEGFQPRPPLDLLQGEFSTRADLRERLRPWRWAAALAGLWLAVTLGQQWLHAHRLQAELDAVNTETRRVFQRSFPEVKQFRDARKQMARRLNALRGGRKQGGADFLTLLAQASEVLGGARDVQIDALSFHDGRLDLRLRAPSLSALERLQQQLQGAGLVAELRGADAGPKGATGQLRLKGA